MISIKGIIDFFCNDPDKSQEDRAFYAHRAEPHFIHPEAAEFGTRKPFARTIETPAEKAKPDPRKPSAYKVERPPEPAKAEPRKPAAYPTSDASSRRSHDDVINNPALSPLYWAAHGGLAAETKAEDKPSPSAPAKSLVTDTTSNDNSRDSSPSESSSSSSYSSSSDTSSSYSSNTYDGGGGGYSGGSDGGAAFAPAWR